MNESISRNIWTIMGRSWDRMLRHALNEYPHEACGALLADRANLVVEAVPTKNATDREPSSRYLVNPGELYGIYMETDKNGLWVCGFYHSHPDHPPVPSGCDVQTAWEAYLYLILSVRQAGFAGGRAWIMDPEVKEFRETGIRIREKT